MAAQDDGWRIRSGPVALTLAGLVATTGLWALAHYRPSPDEAHASVAGLTIGAWAWLRSLHHWAAALMVLLSAMALARRWLRGLSEPDDRLIWWVGLAALALLAAAFMTGRMLAWDQHGWESYAHAQPLVPGTDPTAPADARLAPILLLHIATLPVVGLLVLPALWHRTRHTDPATRPPDPVRRRSLRVALLLGTVVPLALALIAPVRHGPAPIGDLVVARPDWPFLWLVPLESLLGSAGLVIGPLVLGALLALGPWFAARMSRRDRAYALVGLAAALGGLTLLALA